ncbi:ABC transporter ATP-binding protein [Ramlibacter alkalitolerans]|uniref:ABC transporter ATP-binding protein n=2 Tax=Ramlibacter alkalitolerans TaxID=2039631 RepID=A0ABS1JUW5_9BURK|nr:ABC transporter ATP-binding protein [Ramlibacter alkalitolerans]
MQVRPGEIVALLGRNGMGKTSLVRSVMGLGTPRVQAGTVRMEGRDLVGLPAHRIARQRIGYVPQGRRVFQSLTVLEHLEMLARGQPGAWSVSRVFQAFPRLQERQGHRGSQLSGGERQMLAIGRALMTGPRILLMDEPTEGLAPVMVEAVEAILRSLREEGLGILLVEQNLYSALSVADRVILLETGQVVWNGTPAELEAQQDLLERYLGVH